MSSTAWFLPAVALNQHFLALLSMRIHLALACGSSSFCTRSNSEIATVAFLSFLPSPFLLSRQIFEGEGRGIFNQIVRAAAELCTGDSVGIFLPRLARSIGQKGESLRWDGGKLDTNFARAAGLLLALRMLPVRGKRQKVKDYLAFGYV